MSEHPRVWPLGLREKYLLRFEPYLCPFPLGHLNKVTHLPVSQFPHRKLGTNITAQKVRAKGGSFQLRVLDKIHVCRYWSLLLTLLCVWHVNVGACVCRRHVYTCMKAEGQYHVSLLRSHLPWLWKQSLSLGLRLANYTRLSEHRAQDLRVSTSPALDCRCASLSSFMFVGIKHKSSWLQGKHFTQ